MMVPTLTWIVCAALSAAALALLLRRASSAWLDEPNHRSLHARAVPRIGGIALHAGWIIGSAAVAALRPAAFDVSTPVSVPTAGQTGLAAVGFALALAISLRDDLRSTSPAVRFGVQAVAAALLLAGIGQAAIASSLPAALGAIAAVAIAAAIVLATMWSMNLYNFMDGADGLAGSMAVLGFGAYAVVAWPVAPALSLVSIGISGAAAGFLAFNFPPARAFMGDAGSVPLGYLAAALGLAGIASGAWGWWLPPLAFLPFVLDATFTLARRGARGARLWEAHREHAYQKLVLLGWSQRRALVLWWAAMAACALGSVALSRATVAAQWLGLAAGSGALLAVLVAIEAHWRRRSQA